MIILLACSIGSSPSHFDGEKLEFVTDCSMESIQIEAQDVYLETTLAGNLLSLVLCPDVVHNASAFIDENFERYLYCVQHIEAFFGQEYLFLIDGKPAPYHPVSYKNDYQIEATLGRFILHSEHPESQSVQCYASRGYAFFGYTMDRDIMAYNESNQVNKPPGQYLCLMHNATFAFWFLFSFDYYCFLVDHAVVSDIYIVIFGKDYCYDPVLSSTIEFSEIELETDAIVITLCTIIDYLDFTRFFDALKCIHGSYADNFNLTVDNRMIGISDLERNYSYPDRSFKVSSKQIIAQEFVQNAKLYCLTSHSGITDFSDSRHYDCKSSLECFFTMADLQADELVLCKLTNGSHGYYSKSAVYNFNITDVFFSYPYTKGDRVIIGQGGMLVTNFGASGLGLYETFAIHNRTLEIIFCHPSAQLENWVELTSKCVSQLNQYDFYYLDVWYHIEHTSGEFWRTFTDFQSLKKYFFDFEFVEGGMISYCKSSDAGYPKLFPYSVACQSLENYFIEYSAYFSEFDEFYRSVELCPYDTSCDLYTPPYAPIYCNYSVSDEFYLQTIDRSAVQPDCVIIGNQNLTNTILYIYIQKNKCWKPFFETSIHEVFSTVERVENVTSQNFNPDPEPHLVVYLCEKDFYDNDAYQKCIEYIQYIPSITVYFFYIVQGQYYSIYLNAIKNNIQQNSSCNSLENNLYVEFNPYYVVGYKYLSYQNISCVSNSNSFYLQQAFMLHEDNYLYFYMANISGFYQMRNERFSCKVFIIGDNKNNYVYQFFTQHRYDYSDLGLIVWVITLSAAAVFLVVIAAFLVFRVRSRGNAYYRVQTNDE